MFPKVKNFIWYFNHLDPTRRTNRNVSNNFIIDTLKLKNFGRNYNVVRRINEKGDTTISEVGKYGEREIPNNTKEFDAYNKSLDLNLSPKDKEIKIEKNQRGKSNRPFEVPQTTPLDSTEVEYFRFPKITPFGTSHEVVTFKGMDGKTHTWVKYSDGVYNWRPSPGFQTNIYSPKYTGVKIKKEGLGNFRTIELPIDENIKSQVDNLIDKSKNK